VIRVEEVVIDAVRVEEVLSDDSGRGGGAYRRDSGKGHLGRGRSAGRKLV